MTPELITTTEEVDFVFFLLFGISGFMLVGITATMIYFIIRYHRSRNPRPTSRVAYNVPLEVTWTVLPTIIVLAMFWYGWQGYLALANVPKDALPVKVVARMWSWSFEYPNGKTSDKLVVPVGRAIRVDITSADVLHSFFIPAFRVKKDAVPGMTTHVWFRTPGVGSYDIFCAEYCGVGHSDMMSTVEAVSEEEYRRWLTEKAEPESEGRALLQQYGCLGCHSLDGSPGAGPTLQGIFGREETVITDGTEREIVVDADYLKRSILEPNADIVKGFQAIMPGFEGRISEDELQTIVEFLRSGETGEAAQPDPEEQAAEEAKAPEQEREAAAPKTREEEPAAGEPEEKPELEGREVAESKGCLNCHSEDGTRKVGPTFKGLYGRQVTVTRDGETVTLEADADYLRRSIENPAAEIVEGYSPAMPVFRLSEEEMNALLDYLRGLK